MQLITHHKKATDKVLIINFGVRVIICIWLYLNWTDGFTGFYHYSLKKAVPIFKIRCGVSAAQATYASNSP